LSAIVTAVLTLTFFTVAAGLLASTPVLGPVHAFMLFDSQDGGGNAFGTTNNPINVNVAGTGGTVTINCDAGNCAMQVTNFPAVVFDAAVATVGVASVVNPPAVSILGTTLPIPASSLTLNDGGAVHITKVAVTSETNAPAAMCCIFQLASCPTVYDAGANTSSVPGPVECFPVASGFGTYSAVDDWGAAGLGLTFASVCCSTTGAGDGGGGAGGVFTAAAKDFDLSAYGYPQ
jgi:hypothetical protein